MKATKAQVKKMTLGELAAKVPFATKLFHRHHFDFCCRGNQKLEEACRKKGLSEDEVIGELQGLMRGRHRLEWSMVSNAEISQYIIDHYHAGLRACVPEILRLAKRVEAVHSDHPACPTGLSDVLFETWAELEGHMEKEEKILFPMMAERWGPLDVTGPVLQMRREHLDHGESLARIRQLCNGFKCPKDACPTWKALYLSLSALEEDLMEHIHLENNILFERTVGEGAKFYA
jgi:regulator of cell morphogenesis and NO signaling